ncbi:MAG: hypothetical protein R3E12_15745 [Candidatus Eisenbacteria bacterium]|uniref:Uncharacterized protein n=1 Tax=Eiseniibacteriota bacterium TaxID=2212470 RepID=A0A956RPC3_UNCEI|nr:hypothetical protein [Candidatus Eisenbacteria bacterium]
MRVARAILPVLALWALLIGPGLCVTGALEHLCKDEGQATATSCEHEEDCATDPCGDWVLRLDSDPSSLQLSPPALVVPTPVWPEPFSNERALLVSEVPAIPVRSLPRPDSDLPLLI